MSAQAYQVRDIDDDLRTLFRSALDGELAPQPTRRKLAKQPAGWPGLDHREAPVESCRVGTSPATWLPWASGRDSTKPLPWKPGQFSVSNKTVIAIMTVTMAWVLELFVIAMHFVGRGKIPIALQAAILPVMLVMTIACAKWARAEVIAHTPGLMLTPGAMITLRSRVSIRTLPSCRFSR